jgi:hypothetical protein
VAVSARCDNIAGLACAPPSTERLPPSRPLLLLLPPAA